MGLIIDNHEKSYLKEVVYLNRCCQDNNLLLTLSKTKELLVEFEGKQGRNNTTLIIKRSSVERVDRFRYLDVHITKGADLGPAYQLSGEKDKAGTV